MIDLRSLEERRIEEETTKVFFMLWKSETAARNGCCPSCGKQPVGIMTYPDQMSSLFCEHYLEEGDGHTWKAARLVRSFDSMWRPDGWERYLAGNSGAVAEWQMLIARE